MILSNVRRQSRGASRGLRAGFSIPELVVVMSIISIVLAMAGPKVTATIVAANVQSANVEMTARLATARQAAIRRGRGAVFHVSGNKAWVSVDNTGGAELLRDTLFLDDKYGVAATASIDSVRYDARGFANLAASQTFAVSKGGVARTVCVSAAGLILTGGCTL